MKKIIILGAGFSGLHLCDKLSQYRVDYEVLLVDKNKYSHFLPLLPDVISRGISVKNLVYDIERFAKERDVEFLNEEVLSVNLEEKIIEISSGKRVFDYLVIATGSETNFYGKEEIREFAYKLDDAFDAEKLLFDLKEKNFDSYVITGGGYTGVETASNISRYLNKHKISKKVIIIENSSSILGPLPQWMKNYCLDNLKRLKVEILTGVSVQKVEANKIILSNNQEFNKAMLIWAAGVKTADFLNKVNAEKTLQGRIKVDKFLRLNDYCFVIGDAAGFLEEGKYLRMAVQFSLKESDSVFVNLINSIYGLPLYAFKPRDLGYIIPMANNRSCGVILGFKFKGVIPTIMHFLMCIYRSVGLKNKFGLILDLLK
jgi:NADH dehydrogenase